MDTDEGTQSKGRDIAIWPSEVSHFMLDCLCKIKRDGKSGDNGLKKPVWQAVTLSINDRFQLKFEWEQVRNHYRIWKARLRALCDLQKTSGMGWNEAESRFDAPQHFWNELKRKEQRYWKEHRVLSVHLATAAWLGNKVANGNDSSHPSDAIHDDAFANPVPLEELHDLEVEQEETVFL
ncbi:uncharacterized protein LOC122065196 [Macadamia integrifolia]|uniref:uncharacterized protein LOC122065196 n=1 Tax=Macadamia integrifolia TaxID=60698 RepID=UPI001C4FE271|nr:uncharacterized protein LOC122065196 [Macadamia integrifolia]